ncbi:5,10-methylene tetrahydromethanopterin reductase [Pseudoglutamicibacter cumminsii]|uniref:5,10-methylene tetrahydromethanopterin reductase n=1 Tax=Pseudoglutamicibacter cumminsii TaxID=156979 RepID=A0ABX5L4E1_9MICC|nr:5,10-methylene tetrahydromethanopterin reductase [Pseudoglutamicibacter cumminsii]
MRCAVLLNAFEMATPVHQSPGLWRHPESRAADFDQLSYWTGLAQTLDKGGFTALFLADVLGTYDVYGGSDAVSHERGVQVPLLDPFAAVSAMAAVTRRLGFGLTASCTYEDPFLLARRFASLDHLTGGRLGWNIVTSYQDSAARNLGLERQLPHDERYDRADEYMDVMYKLFEGSFAPGSVLKDADAGVFVDPAGVRKAEHKGEYFSVDGALLTHPGPQRTPFLFQAGASARGLRFGAENAEAVFMIGSEPSVVRGYIDRLHDALEAAGRPADAVRTFAMVTVVTGADDEDARRRFESYQQYVDVEGALALFAGWTGVDLAGLDPDAPLAEVETDANQSALRSVTSGDTTREWTVRDIAAFVTLGGRGPVIVGGPESVADQLEAWQAASGVDGFNVCSGVRPADLERFVEYVSPELRRRGLLADAGAEGDDADAAEAVTLRAAVTGQDWLPDSHRGSRFRTGALVEAHS